jgi:tetratricopeptide (TPR) repeat protein
MRPGGMRPGVRPGGALVALLPALLLLSSPRALPQAGTVRAEDRAAAEQYLAEARSQASAGAWDSAVALLEDALQFHPDSSESMYLYATIRLREQATTLEGLNLLERALAANTWTVTDPQAASTELARVLARTRRYARARQVLAGLSGGSASTEPGRGPGLGARHNPEAALLWAQTLRGLGDPARAAAYLEEAVARYPKEPGLYLELARTRQVLRHTARALESLSRGRRELPQAAELTLEAGRLEGERGRRLRLLGDYVEQGGKSPAAAALALSLGPSDRKPWLDRFLDWGGNAALGPLDMLLAYYRTRPGPSADELMQAVRGYNGNRTLDQDEDGWYEELYVFQSGALFSWTLDRDQDGVAEAQARFIAGQPRSLTVGGLEYEFSSYPFLSQVVVREDGARQAYELEPYKRRLEAFLGQPPFGPGNRPASLRLRLRAEPLPDQQAIRGLAYAMRETLPGGEERRYTLQAGQVERLEEQPYDEGRWARIVYYARGLPVDGKRDLNHDGVYEVRETYTAGKLTGIAEYRHGGERPEFWQEFAPQGVRSFWDYDGNGTADCRETERSDGAVLLEFSTRLNGVFNAAAVFRGDRLEEYRLGGRSLAVIPAAASGLYWLGRPGGEPGRFLQLPDGLHLLAGNSFFVFTYRGARYVEPL